jgi:hypothetical protein
LGGHQLGGVPLQEIQMNFKWINKQDVCSSEGYILKRDDRFHYSLILEDHVLIIPIEPIKNGVEIYMPKKPIWQPPHENEIITEEQLSSIVNTISSAMKFKKMKYKINNST